MLSSVFMAKAKDYGTSWRILRLPSITDQIYIKANRIRTIEGNKKALINEGVEPEYIGIINYCIIALIQLDLNNSNTIELLIDDLEKRYDKKVKETKELMQAKNHDYGEAWRSMRINSFTDMILVRVHRIKQIESNDGETLVSEGVYSNYQDTINYAIFALIKLQEQYEKASSN